MRRTALVIGLGMALLPQLIEASHRQELFRASMETGTRTSISTSYSFGEDRSATKGGSDSRSAIDSSRHGRRSRTRYMTRNVSVSNGIDREQVLRLVRRYWNQIKYCYEKEQIKIPELAGEVTVAFDIGPWGDVAIATILESSLSDSNVESCMIEMISKWRFLPSEEEGSAMVTLTFVLKVED